ncbi:DUF6494 family protein [Roseomonas genomospecies 6]|uniref:Uncharacterized protein n=1 Tax=Roseomonas genomospecies 6 TaxID=214106 RepID=A0A9W7NGJ1_9PROT|nr:DUF6494 family protein [Roseomonas genomospecies 6]KAA0676583.1 hypothetical protein DS843_26920 [Roseomonas genomospecies 6]
MNHDTFNMGIRKYLKVVGVTSQREIERAVSEAIEAGKLTGNETLQARMVLTIESVGLEHEIKGEIALE